MWGDGRDFWGRIRLEGRGLSIVGGGSFCGWGRFHRWGRLDGCGGWVAQIGCRIGNRFAGCGGGGVVRHWSVVYFVHCFLIKK